jgi:hypothetical protein
MEELPPPHEDEEPSRADAQWLVNDKANVSPPPAHAGNAESDAEGYAIEGGDAEFDDALPASPVAPAPTRKADASGPRRVETSLRPAGEPAVEQVWSRWAEWGPTFVRLGLVAAGVGVLAVLAIQAGLYFAALASAAAGFAAMLILSYPIVITLERPVRVTPEQAVKDFFEAVSHLLPHYRRMWLLLSTEGRISSAFSSYEGFCAYWTQRIAELSGQPAWRFSPLRFAVEDFRAEKSAGLITVTATYTVCVFHRDASSASPVDTFAIEATLVKGPDRMWYLGKGTLP